MTMIVTRVGHDCEQGQRIEASVASDGRLWWGFIDGIQLKLSIERCPLCGYRLPQKLEKENVK